MNTKTKSYIIELNKRKYLIAVKSIVLGKKSSGVLVKVL